MQVTFPSYPIFLYSCWNLFQLKEVFENKPYLGSSTGTLLEIFRTYDFDEQLCELFLHNIMCEYVSENMVAHVFSYMGELQF